MKKVKENSNGVTLISLVIAIIIILILATITINIITGENRNITKSSRGKRNE